MRFARGIISFVFVVAQYVALAPAVKAEEQFGVVISQIYPGATGVASQEFIELSNNANVDIDVSNWCIYYISSSGTTTTKLTCFTPPDSQTRLWVKSGGYVVISSNEYQAANPSVVADAFFPGGMSATGGHVKVINSSSNEIDRIGWGTAAYAEAAAVAAPSNMKSLERLKANARYQDTNNNAVDVIQAVPTLHASSIYEVVTIVDLCTNIPDAQTTIPTGYAIDDDSQCQPDSCINIDGLQTSVPDYYDADQNGNCIEHDECENIEGIQKSIPSNMMKANIHDCIWNISPLIITELLPNAVGSDTGNEFIEVYNPTDEMVDLSLYSVDVGSGTVKTYAFPLGATIAPGEYRTFSDSVMKFTLVNTTSRVVLHAIDGSMVSDTGIYENPAEGESWALIDDIWQYTNQPTPNSENKSRIDEEIMVNTADNVLSECPAGKYRNPLTNRCRTIVGDVAILATCANDQYRNPETGRCKKIESSVLAPCKDNQYRSEETNRCRTIVTASTQKPCKDNQYRSEETSRCRNIATNNIPNVPFAVQSTSDSPMAFVGWFALAGVAIAACGYAGWEWRYEMRSTVRNFITLFSKS